MSLGLKERNLTAHRSVCSSEISACHYAPDCKTNVSRTEIKTHTLPTCNERLVSCEHCCAQIRASKWKEHRESLLGCTDIILCPVVIWLYMAVTADADDTFNIPESAVTVEDTGETVKTLNLSSDMGNQLSCADSRCAAECLFTVQSIASYRACVTVEFHTKGLGNIYRPSSSCYSSTI